jgi:subtilisin family serine protease
VAQLVQHVVTALYNFVSASLESGSSKHVTTRPPESSPHVVQTDMPDRATASDDKIAWIVEADASPKELATSLHLDKDETLESLTDGFFSARLRLSTAERLLALPQVTVVRKKSVYRPSSRQDVIPRDHYAVEFDRNHLLGGIEEDGSGIIIGVVDTGFDLSLPAFRIDSRLRVLHLLDQMENREYSREELEQLWSRGINPGADLFGHGTLNARIAAGGRYERIAGMAPAADLLLVRTNFVDTDVAVAWIFKKARGAPCVVNMSFGSHDGPHDGTSSDERLHEKLTGTGRIIVVSAGNDRLGRIHVGHDFYPSQVNDVLFDIYRPPRAVPRCKIECWTAPEDEFDIILLSPDRNLYHFPQEKGELGPLRWRHADIYFGCYFNPINHARCSRIEIMMDREVENSDLQNWRLRVICKKAQIGRFDAWIALPSMASFQPGPLVDSTRTVSIPATGRACISVGSTSRYSSIGPTRDGRPKPDILVPAVSNTSIAAPVVSGVVALMLQRRPALNPDDVREILKITARSVSGSETPVLEARRALNQL